MDNTYNVIGARNNRLHHSKYAGHFDGILSLNDRLGVVVTASKGGIPCPRVFLYSVL